MFGAPNSRPSAIKCEWAVDQIEHWNELVAVGPARHALDHADAALLNQRAETTARHAENASGRRNGDDSERVLVVDADPPRESGPVLSDLADGFGLLSDVQNGPSLPAQKDRAWRGRAQIVSWRFSTRLERKHDEQ